MVTDLTLFKMKKQPDELIKLLHGLHIITELSEISNSIGKINIKHCRNHINYLDDWRFSICVASLYDLNLRKFMFASMRFKDIKIRNKFNDCFSQFEILAKGEIDKYYL